MGWQSRESDLTGVNARSPVHVPPAPPPRDGESWAPCDRDDRGGAGCRPWARVSFPHRVSTGALRPLVNQQLGTQGGGTPALPWDAPRPLGRSRDCHHRGPPEAGLLLGTLPLRVLECLLPPDLG